jgi:hypothetical protein
MDTFMIEKDIPVFGFRVEKFPLEIKETFDRLVTIIGGFEQPLYGISWMEGNEVIYYAMADDEIPGLAKHHAAEQRTIQKGNYLKVTVKDWLSKTDKLNAIFHEMMSDPRADLSSACVEIYKNDEEMYCLVKLSGS